MDTGQMSPGYSGSKFVWKNRLINWDKWLRYIKFKFNFIALFLLISFVTSNNSDSIFDIYAWLLFRYKCYIICHMCNYVPVLIFILFVHNILICNSNIIPNYFHSFKVCNCLHMEGINIKLSLKLSFDAFVVFIASINSNNSNIISSSLLQAWYRHIEVIFLHWVINCNNLTLSVIFTRLTNLNHVLVHTRNVFGCFPTCNGNVFKYFH